MQLLHIFIDTNIADPKEVAPLEAMLTDVPHEIGFVDVTEREHGYEIGYLGRRVTETGVWGESSWGSSNRSGPISGQFVVGESTVAADGATSGRCDVVADDGDFLERTLSIISAGSFPKRGHRENLTSDVRRQLRDATIFEAHVRAGRQVLVGNDVKAYLKDGRRAQLEALGGTKIRTLVEFTDLTANWRFAPTRLSRRSLRCPLWKGDRVLDSDGYARESVARDLGRYVACGLPGST